jgi:hypothetical protein
MEAKPNGILLDRTLFGISDYVPNKIKKMESIEVINKTTITVDGENFYKENIESNLLRETNGYFRIGDEITINETGNLCSVHPEREKYKGWKDFPRIDITKPLTILVFKRLNYPDACILKQGKGIYIFSGTESFTLHRATKEPTKKPFPKTKKELEQLYVDWCGRRDTAPNGVDFEIFLENYEG